MHRLIRANPQAGARFRRSRSYMGSLHAASRASCVSVRSAGCAAKVDGRKVLRKIWFLNNGVRTSVYAAKEGHVDTFVPFGLTWTRQEPDFCFVKVAKTRAFLVYRAVEVRRIKSNDRVEKSAHDPTSGSEMK